MAKPRGSAAGRSKGGRTTAQHFRGEEHIIGRCFSQHNYDPNYPTPTWDSLLNLLAKEKIKGKMDILFCGKAGSDGQVGSTGIGVVTQADVQRVFSPFWGGKGQPSGPRAITTDPEMTAQLAFDLLGLNVMPQHITGIVVRERV